MRKDLAVLLTPFSQQGVTFYYYRPQTKLRQGNVFTRVCREFCPQRGVSGRQPPGQTPPGQTPPWTDTPCLGRHPPGQTPPWPDTTPWPDIPLSRRLLQRTVRILLECIFVIFYLVSRRAKVPNLTCHRSCKIIFPYFLV